MENTKKDATKVDNGLKRFIEPFVDPSSKKCRIDYGNMVVEYLAKPENGGHQVKRGHVYSLVNNNIRITPGNIHIAKAVKAVSKKFAKELESLAEA
ncbi:hypothetical protein [Spirosoma luteum]|uniref:hypothetical protein n=1 Tax=Spirosoma luteum TaxID=431553 RepID=UPI000376BCCC|nr:hypothetical protein [Spirosoma luteum]